MIRKEKKSSSGRNKGEEKRSGTDSPQAAVSPYHSTHDLTTHDHEEDTEWLDDLTHKSAGKRCTAAATLLSFLQHNNGSAAQLENAETIMLYVTRSLGPASKAGESERLNAIKIGTGMLFLYGDDHVSFYNEFAASLAHAITANKMKSDLCGDMFNALALIYAMDDQVLVDEQPLSKALHEILVAFPDVEKFPPYVLASMVRCVAYCGDYKDCLAQVANGIATHIEDFDVIIAGVEGVGVANQRYPQSFEVEQVEGFLRTTTKEAGRTSKRELLPLVRSVLSSITEKTIPEDTITMQFKREATVSGFINCYLLDLLRDFAGDGTQRHISKNPTVRRIFKISEDFSRRREDHEFVGHHETRLEKETTLRDRAKDRDAKQQRLNDDY